MHPCKYDTWGRQVRCHFDSLESPLSGGLFSPSSIVPNTCVLRAKTGQIFSRKIPACGTEIALVFTEEKKTIRKSQQVLKALTAIRYTLHAILIKYSLPVYLPVFLDRVLVSPLLLLRRVWYGYTFRRIKLANCDKYAIVDPCDFASLSKYTWLLDCEYGSRRAIRLAGTVCGHISVHMHRQILADELEAKSSALLVKLFIDHINCNALDNRRANLRIVTRMQNAKNRSKSKKKCSSVYKGVHWNKSGKKWGAMIRANRKPIYLGYFTDEIEAAKAYDEAAKKYHGEFACLNFPPPDKKGLKNLIKYWFSNRFQRGFFDADSADFTDLEKRKTNDYSLFAND